MHFQYGVRCAASQKKLRGGRPLHALPPSRPALRAFSAKAAAQGCWRGAAPRGLRGEDESAAGGGGGGGCFESCLELGAGGKVRSSPFGKGRPVPLLHHTRFPFLASFRGRQTSFLFLPLFVTLSEAAFPQRRGSGGHDPRRSGTGTGRPHFSAVRGEARGTARRGALNVFFFFLFPSEGATLFFFFWNSE